MEYRIDYIVYNNSDFKQTVFCETKEEADSKMIAMKKIKHITAISITPPIVQQPLSGSQSLSKSCPTCGGKGEILGFPKNGLCPTCNGSGCECTSSPTNNSGEDCQHKECCYYNKKFDLNCCANEDLCEKCNCGYYRKECFRDLCSRCNDWETCKDRIQS